MPSSVSASTTVSGFRIGRMKTPYLYEYFSIAEGDLIAPERSLFAGNLAVNRQIGAMFLGELFEADSATPWASTTARAIRSATSTAPRT